MIEKTIYTRVQNKHAKESEWLTSTLVPLMGELIVYEPDDTYNYSRYKIGDGVTAVNDLPFSNVQPDWDQNDETKLDYIKNKPTNISAFTNDAGYLTEESKEEILGDTNAVLYVTQTLTEAQKTQARGNIGAASASQFETLNEEKANKSGLTLGVHTDGLVYIFIDGVPHGNGLEITANVIEGDVFGYVDENNTIVLNGNLADGSYSVKYEMENGDVVDIGNMVLDSNVYYSVTNSLTNCTSNNSAKTAVQGGSYSAVISANDGYELKSVTVTMGGSPVTVTDGVINIASVTGDIVITAVAEEAVVAEPITEDITILKDTSLVLDGTDRANTTGYCATVAIDVSNLLKPCTIHLTGARWTNGSAADSSYIRTYIEDASGNKLIGDYTYPTKMPSGVNMTRNNDTDSDVTVTITSDNIGKLRFAGYWAWGGITDENQNGTVMVAKATLTYTPNGAATTYTVINNLTNCTNSNNAVSINENGGYSATISADNGYELSSVAVTMGGVDITSTAVNGGVINVASVTGDIIITAVAEEEQAAEPITVDIALTDGIRIGSDGGDRTQAGYCATQQIDLTNIPKPCTIHLTKAKWLIFDGESNTMIRVYAKKADGTQLISDVAKEGIGGSYFTIVDNSGGIGNDVTVTVVSDAVGYIRFSGCWTGNGISDSTNSFAEANTKATLTYTPVA